MKKLLFWVFVRIIWGVLTILGGDYCPYLLQKQKVRDFLFCAKSICIYGFCLYFSQYFYNFPFLFIFPKFISSYFSSSYSPLTRIVDSRQACPLFQQCKKWWQQRSAQEWWLTSREGRRLSPPTKKTHKKRLENGNQLTISKLRCGVSRKIAQNFEKSS